MNLRPLLFFPPIAVGIAGYMWLTAPENTADKATIAEAVTAVRALTAGQTMATPSASGYGRVVAEDSWSAISQVQGRATFVSGNLDVGGFLSAGTEIIRIDPRDYEISLTRAKASLSSARAALQELEASEQNTRATIELERRIEDLRRDELTRQKTLLTRGSVAQATVDASVRTLLAQEKVLLGLENTFRLLPAQRATLQATIETRLVEIEEAERALANTSLSTPLTGRVTSHNVSLGQFVRIGDTLATIEGTAASEVVAEFQIEMLGNLFFMLRDKQARLEMASIEVADAFERLKSLDLRAEVYLQSGDQTFSWPAQLVRLDASTDPATGTVGLVVQIDNPTRPDPSLPGPPLTNGSFVEVRLSAPEPVASLRIPRSAVRYEGDMAFVYTVDAQSKLGRKDIKTSAVHGDTIVVAEGLSDGDTIVLSDMRPAVIGMRLDPINMETE